MKRALGQGFSLAIGCLVLSSMPARAPFYTPTYTETVQEFDQQIAEVMHANGLESSDATFALTTAAGWFYFFPCRGSANDVPRVDGGSIAQAYMLASPLTRVGAAMLEITAILLRESVDGRKATPEACTFAKETLIANTR
jgi:hypothetical protein